ncbi:MAG: molybdenum-pterin-binding protein [Blastopirellula sp.]|nr:MAG: molybdenum-pterin-binding protein [Blastopirellula sp.]
MNLISSKQAAQLLGIEVATFYDWLSQSDAGQFSIRGQEVTISYFQGGRSGQGRIRIEEAEVKRLLDCMRVTPKSLNQRKPSKPKQQYNFISAKLGKPTD